MHTTIYLPHGVAYVSYNTYPGWHMREMVRHMMRYHAGEFDEPKEQIEQARALLTFLASASDEAGPYGQLLNREIERLSQASDSYLYHEHLEQTNAPLYFHQFIERAERAGLQYLSEADVGDMFTTSLFATPIVETLDRISPDLLHIEQYMDFVRNRQFRQTLLCHRQRRLRRALTPEFMRDLMASSPAVADSRPIDLAQGVTVVFTNGTYHATVTIPSTKAALALLMEAWPRAIAIDELCAMALERAAPFLADTTLDSARRMIMTDLFASVRCGLVQLHTSQLNCIRTASTTPRAHPLAVYQVEAGERVINAHHKSTDLDALGREVLALANGQRDRSGIVDALVQRYEIGSLVIEAGGTPVVCTRDGPQGAIRQARACAFEPRTQRRAGRVGCTCPPGFHNRCAFCTRSLAILGCFTSLQTRRIPPRASHHDPIQSSAQLSATEREVSVGH